MNARIFSIAGVAAALVLGAGAAQANPFEGDQSIAPQVTTTSHLTRAQVQAQVSEAQRNGTMAVIGDRVNTYNGQASTSTLTRAEVQKQAHDALIAGTLPEGESFGE